MPCAAMPDSLFLLALHRDLVFPSNSKVQPRLTNLHCARPLHLRKISVSLHANDGSAGSAQLSVAAERRARRRTEGDTG